MLVKVVAVITIVVLCSRSSGAVDGVVRMNDQGMVISSRSIDEVFDSLVEKASRDQAINAKDCETLRLIIKQRAGADLSETPLGKRQELIKKVIGNNNYAILENILVQQLLSSDPQLKMSAVRAIPQIMYSDKATDILRKLVFCTDRQIQFMSVLGLSYLEVPGGDSLLTYMLLSGILTDSFAEDAIAFFELVDLKFLTDHSAAIMTANSGPMAIHSMLPVLRLRPDFDQAILSLFRSDVARVPKSEDLTVIEHAKVRLEYSLLKEIYKKFGTAYSEDVVVRKKLDEYASLTTHTEIYTLALLAFEISGTDLAYFEKMLNDKSTPQKKANILKLIIDRIRRGSRLNGE